MAIAVYSALSSPPAINGDLPLILTLIFLSMVMLTIVVMVMNLEMR